MKDPRNTNALAVILSVAACVLAYAVISDAGNLNPPGPPASSMYTLDELYQAVSALSAPKRYVTRSSGALTTYVKFEAIDGESNDVSHPKWCDAITMHQGHKFVPADYQGRERSGAVYEDISIAKEYDKASPKLAEKCAKGEVIPRVQIEITATFGSGRVTYLKYDLKNCMVTTYNTTGGSNEGPPLEEITLNFEEIKVTYTQYDAAGNPVGNIEYTWKKEKPA